MLLKRIALSLVLLTQSLPAQDVNIAVVDPIPVLFENNNVFAFNLFPSIDHPKKNLIYSPFSIFSCLSMVYTGAARETEIVMKKGLQLTFHQADVPEAYRQFFQQKTDPRLRVANALWANQDTPFIPHFLKTLQESFEANATSLDFSRSASAAAIINEWVDNQTEGKITSLLEGKNISSSTRMILTNAIYFQGKWASPFSPKKTRQEPFYFKKYESIPTQIMNTVGHFSYYENDAFQILSLPFQKEEASHADLVCLIFLPKQHDALSLSDEQYLEVLAHLNSTYVSIKLPKFTLDQHFDLTNPLKNQGMALAFSDGADFSKIDGLRDLFISQVIHKAYFSLDENGVVAAAATSTSMNATSAGPTLEPIVFHVNRPFLFLIADLETKGIYFLGKYYTP